MIGGQSRGVLTSMIYEKAMVVSSRAKAGGVLAVRAPESGDADQSGKGGECRHQIKRRRTRLRSHKGEEEIKRKRSSVEDGTGWTNGTVRVSREHRYESYRLGLWTFARMVWASPLACVVSLVLLLVNLTLQRPHGLRAPGPRRASHHEGVTELVSSAEGHQ